MPAPFSVPHPPGPSLHRKRHTKEYPSKLSPGTLLFPFLPIILLLAKPDNYQFQQIIIFFQHSKTPNVLCVDHLKKGNTCAPSCQEAKNFHGHFYLPYCIIIAQQRGQLQKNREEGGRILCRSKESPMIFQYVK